MRAMSAIKVPPRIVSVAVFCKENWIVVLVFLSWLVIAYGLVQVINFYALAVVVHDPASEFTLSRGRYAELGSDTVTITVAAPQSFAIRIGEERIEGVRSPVPLGVLWIDQYYTLQTTASGHVEIDEGDVLGILVEGTTNKTRVYPTDATKFYVFWTQPITIAAIWLVGFLLTMMGIVGIAGLLENRSKCRH